MSLLISLPVLENLSSFDAWWLLRTPKHAYTTELKISDRLARLVLYANVESDLCLCYYSMYLGSFYIARFVSSLRVFAFEGLNANSPWTFFLLAWYIVTPVGRFLEILIADIIFIYPRTFFSWDVIALPWEKMYISLETILCFLQLSDRAYVSQARCIDLFLLLVILAPHDSNEVY